MENKPDARDAWMVRDREVARFDEMFVDRGFSNFSASDSEREFSIVLLSWNRECNAPMRKVVVMSVLYGISFLTHWFKRFVYLR